MQGGKYIVMILCCLLANSLQYCTAQKRVRDSTILAKPILPKKIKKKPAILTIFKKDTGDKSTHSPQKAVLRSAVLPGWGQVYNKQTWKVPIIYAGLGITAGVFVYNLQTYNDVRFAYNARISKDTPAILQIKDYIKQIDVSGLQVYRRKFRQQIDYSALFFIVFWGLNCADATVFAHLKNFDVSDKISGNIKLGKSSIANTTGLNLQLDIHKKRPEKLVVVK